MIRVVLPYQLQELAGTGREVKLELPGRVTPRVILDELETCYPMLRGMIRDAETKRRRDFIRFFACGRDFSLDDPDADLPESVAQGRDEFRIVGAMAGG
jgi:sulfur-carrier protein